MNNLDKRYTSGAVQGRRDIKKSGGSRTYHPYALLDTVWGRGYREAQDKWIYWCSLKK